MLVAGSFGLFCAGESEVHRVPVVAGINWGGFSLPNRAGCFQTQCSSTEAAGNRIHSEQHLDDCRVIVV